MSPVSVEQALRENQLRWDDLVPHHVGSAHYGLRDFLLGGDSLTPSEQAELGAVAGKRLLHTQCHFGMDTLSWARRGAHVTGVDFSPAAIDAARKIAARLELPARFEVAEVTALDHLAVMRSLMGAGWGNRYATPGSGPDQADLLRRFGGDEAAVKAAQSLRFRFGAMTDREAGPAWRAAYAEAGGRP